MADLWSDIINDALYEIMAYGAGTTPGTDDQNLAIRYVNRIIDAWAARKVYAWSETFQLFTLTPNHQPHLIGPGLTSPDFAQAVRPPRLALDGAALVLTDTTPNVDVPLNVRDADWWNNERVKSITTNVPTDLYYEPDFPNGSLYLWPVPAFAYGLRLRLRTFLQQITSLSLTSAVDAPPGYEKALVLTLAEDLCTPFGRPIPPELPGRAARARADLGINNQRSPRIASADNGTRGRPRGGFNYYTGE